VRLTRKQLMLLHAVPTRLGIDEAARRLIQRNAGGFYSAADATVTREGFIAVMAFYEQFAGGDLGHLGFRFTAGYWRDEDLRANPLDPLRHRLRADAAAIGLSGESLDAFLAGEHMSCGACSGVDDASAYWLRRAIEACKAIRRRGGLRRAGCDASRPSGPARRASGGGRLPSDLPRPAAGRTPGPAGEDDR